jgi:hypothetical protein
MAGQLEHLADVPDRSSSRLGPQMFATPKLPCTDSGSESHQDVGLGVDGEAGHVKVRVAIVGTVLAPEPPVSETTLYVHCRRSNCSPRSVEISFDSSGSGGTSYSCHEELCGKGKLELKHFKNLVSFGE